MSRLCSGIAVAVAVFACAFSAQARSFRVSQIPNGSVNSCANCHVNPGGGGSRNAFGQAVEAGLISSNVDWGPALASLDSDGDGFTNGQELQDPNGTWQTGQSAPGSASMVSKPGSASSVPPQTNSNPTLASVGSKSVNEGSTLSFSLSASDPDGDSVSFSASSLPSGASLSGASFSWTPGFSQSGNYSVTFTASDGEGGTDSETVSISVENLNREPELGAIGNRAVAEDEALSFSVSATDADGDAVDVSVVDLPAGASFSDDLFTWTPDFAQAGTHSLTFTANDGQGGTSSETIEIIVEDVNRPPVFTEIGDQIVGEGETLILVLMATDPDGHSVSFSMSEPPQGADLFAATFSWTPDFDQAGAYPVTFFATDELGEVVSEAISVTVEDRTPPEGPVAIDFDLVAGDQGQRVSGPAVAAQIHALQLLVTGAPEVTGWSVEMQFDPVQLRYVSGSFRPGGFISGLDIEDSAVDGQLSVSGRASETGVVSSGDGDLGVLSFEVMPGFGGSAAVTIVQVDFFRVDDSADSRTVHSSSSIVADPVTGVLPGDFDGTGKVDFEDFFLFADKFGGTDPLYDLDRNGTVDLSDFFVFADNFGRETPSG